MRRASHDKPLACPVGPTGAATRRGWGRSGTPAGTEPMDTTAAGWLTEYAEAEQMERDDLLMTMNGWVRHGG